MRSSLADYEVLGPWGAGGDVDGTWLARAPERLGEETTVVVTELSDPGALGWPALVQRLAQLAAVSDEHLPRLLEAGRTEEEDGPVAWVARTEPAARPLGGGPVEDRQVALRAVAAAARGAHALHEAGLAHGGIRPSAVLADGERWLLELPVRRLAQSPVLASPPRAPADLDPTEPATLWGEGPSRPGDIWSLGATVHAVASGHLVHPELIVDAPVTAVQRVLLEPPQLAPELGDELAELVRRCLSPDPADRPATAADLATDLERLAGQR